MRVRSSFVLLALAVFVLAAAAPAEAQLGKLKKKAKDAAGQKAAEQVEKTLEGGGEAPPAEAPEAGAPAAEAPAAQAPAAGGGGSAAAEDMTLYTKFDFVPGDKVLFCDDLAREETGEFPSRWNLDRGVFEIARADGGHWILCTDKGSITPKVAGGPLPDKYTVELEFYAAGDDDGWYTVYWLDADGEPCGYVRIGYSYMTSVAINDKPQAGKDLAKLARGRHVMRIMATRSTLKCYIDQERIANVPKVDGFAPAGFRVEMDPYFEGHQNSRIGAFRYAEGGKTMREQLDESGRIVTHGILFDSGSDRIKAESYKTLTDIGAMLGDDPALRLSIEGHTDADGADAANLTLSQARAVSVRSYLMEKHGIDAGRLETKGLGESQPLDGNDTPEGKANNRRVELVRL